MSKPARRRWKCPRCGAGALGPQRPRKNASVRYCFPCSAKAGVLVERECPSLERQREATRQRSAAKRAAAKQRSQEREARRWVFGGRDLRKEARALCRYHGIPLPRLTLRLRKTPGTTGHSWGGRVTMTIYAQASAGQAVALLAHELAHEATLQDHGHGDAWRAAFCGSLLDLYEVTVEAAGSSHELHANAEQALDACWGVV